MKKICFYLIGLFFTVTCFNIQAQEFNEKIWHASWINNNQAQDKTNSWVAFRNNIELDKVPAKSEIRIAVDSKYWMWINGELMVFEGGLKRGQLQQALIMP